jgi:uncharacterized integral membrane protein
VLQVFVFLALAFAVLIAIFAVQNTTVVSVSFLAWRADQVAASVLVLCSAALGAGMMLLLGTAREVKLRLQVRNLGQRLRAAEQRLQAMETQQKALPAASSTDTSTAPPSLESGTEHTTPGV